jgi:hypothetical protein
MTIQHSNLGDPSRFRVLVACSIDGNLPRASPLDRRGGEQRRVEVPEPVAIRTAEVGSR